MLTTPIQETVEGEPREIHPFPPQPSRRSDQPLSISAVVHGHAHHGAPEGHHTNAGHNVSWSLMKERFPIDRSV